MKWKRFFLTHGWESDYKLCMAGIQVMQLVQSSVFVLPLDIA